MKVTTDACLFGALVDASGVEHILDIGTGTGLLALMLAQRSPAVIDAVELNEAVAAEAAANFAASPWADRLQLHQQDIADFQPPAPYDLIVSNPPFFSGHSSYEDKARDQAMNTAYLPFATLSKFVKRWLSPKGKAWVLLPDHEAGMFHAVAAKEQLHAQEEITIRNYEGGAVFRRVIAYGHQQKIPLQERDLVIYAEPVAASYTAAFTQLLAPYYLYL